VVTLSDVVPSIEEAMQQRAFVNCILKQVGTMGNVHTHGKQLLKNKIESNTSSRSFRDPSRIDKQIYSFKD
jgi:hypothetical protein